MSSASTLWINTDTIDSKGQGHLLDFNSVGATFAFGEPNTVKGWAQRIQQGEAAEVAAHGFGRIPWANFEWFEWGDDLGLHFSYRIDGHGSYSARFEAKDDAQREAITNALRSLGIFTASERALSTLEIVKPPLGGLAGVLFVVGVLFWVLGQEVQAGGGRTRARMAMASSVANFLGYGGLSAIAAISVVVVGGFVAMRLKNPPVVHRLSASSNA